MNRPSLWLPALLALLAGALCVQALPMIDEESYLDIAGQISGHPMRPYDWWRPWQPWGSAPTDNAYVFAHPPGHLWWLAGWRGLLGQGLAFRVAATVPWAALLGWGVGSLAEDVTKRPGLAALAWLASPIALLGLQAGLMIDLGTVALGTGAMAAWSRSLRDGRARWLVACGLLLGLAGSYKYPALLLVLVPVLHTLKVRTVARLAPVLATFAGVWLGVQVVLWAQYGSPHLVHVLSTADQIARGPLLSRAAGTVLRLGLAVSPGALAELPALALAGAPLGLLPAGLVPAEGGRALLLALGLLGAGLLARAALALREDAGAVMLGIWALLVVGGVVVGHNYVGGRYLLPAVTPLVLLVARGIEHRPRWAAGLAVPGLILGGALVHAERQHARAWADAADQVIAAHEPGVFTGEWTFRWRMEQAGWTFWSPDQALEPGQIVALPTHASPGPGPQDGRVLAQYDATGFGVVLVDLERGVGYHAETLGPRPLAIGAGVLERVTVIEVPTDAPAP